MNTVRKIYDYAKEEIISDVKKSTNKIFGYDQLDRKNILQFSKYDNKESIAEKILKNRSNVSNY